MKTCSKCSELKPLESFSPAKQCRDGRRPECKACHNAIEKARDKSHRVTVTPEYKRASQLKLRYGITPEQYDELLAAQDGVCAICDSPEPGRRRSDFMPVDHDHVTGEVRGILCHDCNTLLGAARDNPTTLRRAILYLAK